MLCLAFLRLFELLLSRVTCGTASDEESSLEKYLGIAASPCPQTHWPNPIFPWKPKKTRWGLQVRNQIILPSFYSPNIHFVNFKYFPHVPLFRHPSFSFWFVMVTSDGAAFHMLSGLCYNRKMYDTACRSPIYKKLSRWLNAQFIPLSPLLEFFHQTPLPKPGTLFPPSNSQLERESHSPSIIDVNNG